MGGSNGFGAHQPGKAIIYDISGGKAIIDDIFTIIDDILGRVGEQASGIFNPIVNGAATQGQIWQLRGKFEVDIPHMPPESGGVCIGVDLRNHRFLLGLQASDIANAIFDGADVCVCVCVFVCVCVVVCVCACVRVVVCV